MIEIFKKLRKAFAIHNVMCRFGYHYWLMDKDTIVKCNRTCTRCGKWQHSMYDMAYGDTYWVDGKYW